MGLIREMKSKEERREIIRRALKIQKGEISDTTIPELATEHGIARGTVYQYLRYVEDDPEGRLREAEDEVEFRLEVLRLLGYTEWEIEEI